MLIDTHCHMNLIVKNTFDVPLSKSDLTAAQEMINQAQIHNVQYIINVGTNFIESKNCIELAYSYTNLYAAVGIHPNDLTDTWQRDINDIKELVLQDNNQKIVAIGECGIDKHYPGYNLPRQKDAFKQHIELALELNKAVIVHSRDARDETLEILELYYKDNPRVVIHCFSEDLNFAQQVIQWGFYLGIGGTITYPKNKQLRDIIQHLGLDQIVLETDAPFLPPQIIRGKKNSPQYIQSIAAYIASLLNISIEQVAIKTGNNAQNLFRLPK